jgi:DNA primase
MIDLTEIKSRTNLIQLAARYTSLNGKGKERYGPCPLCGGEDRFHVQPAWFFCRRCHPRRGDAIEFAQWFKGLQFFEALQWLGYTPPVQLKSQAPSPTWQLRALKFAEHCRQQLWSPVGQQGLDYLLSRGLTESTIKTAGLGYNTQDYNDPGRYWGLDRPAWLPGPGIVIPWFIDGQIWRVNIRLLEPRKTNKGDTIKYIGPAGWAGGNPLYNAGELSIVKPAVLVEGEFCALTINQVAGDLVTAVATGSTEASRAGKWIARLMGIPLVLVAFDDEPSKGTKAGKFWLKLLKNGCKCTPLLGKDINDMHQAGVDVRQWLKIVLATYRPKQVDTGQAVKELSQL